LHGKFKHTKVNKKLLCANKKVDAKENRRHAAETTTTITTTTITTTTITTTTATTKQVQNQCQEL